MNKKKIHSKKIAKFKLSSLTYTISLMRLIVDLKLPVNKINTKSFDELSTDKYRAAEVEEKYSV